MTRGDHVFWSNALLVVCFIVTVVAVVVTTGWLDKQHETHWISGAVLFAVAVGLFWFREAWKAVPR